MIINYGRKSTTSANHEFQFAQLHELYNSDFEVARTRRQLFNLQKRTLGSYCFFWNSISGRCLQQTFDLRKAAIAIVLTVSMIHKKSLSKSLTNAKSLVGNEAKSQKFFGDSAL